MGGLTQVTSSTKTEDPLHHDYVSTTVYGSAYARQDIPRFEMPEDEMPSETVYRFIKDELLMDGNPALNLASFVTTYVEDECQKLMVENLTKNFVDVEEYPACGEIEARCVNMIGKLFNAPEEPNPNADGHYSTCLGVSTIGSSEAIILGVLSAKRRWQIKRRAEGKSTEKPNLVMNAAVQVCWEKAARYLDVEERYWYCDKDRYVADPKELVDLVDENTILVCAILGSTYTGQYEDIEAICNELEKKNKEIGTDVYVHVDAASGGFVVPFVNPDLKWDFRLPRVASINTSGHKYGLSLAGVGWALWRSKDLLPDDLVFHINYLGSPQISFSLNFSKSAIQVINQYYQLIRLGKNGYRAIMQNLTNDADWFAEQVERIQDGNKFVIMSERSGKGLPLVAWRLKNQEDYDEFAIARHLRMRGWIVPAYTMAPHSEGLKLLRVVIRSDMSRSRTETLLRDLKEAVAYLDATPKSVLDHAKKNPLKEATTGHGRKPHQKNIKASDSHSLQGKHGKTHCIC